MKRFTAVLITILFVFPTVFYAEEFTAIENKFRAKVIAKAKKLGAIYKKKIIAAKKAKDGELADQLSQALEQHKEKTKKLLESMVFTPTKQQIEKEIIRLAKINLKLVEDVGPFDPLLFPDKKFANIIRQRINKDADEDIFLSDLRNITYLSSLHTKCDIAGIQYLPRLRVLEISEQTVFDPKEINKSKSITDLRVSSTSNESRIKLQHLTNIKSLQLSDPEVKDLKPFMKNQKLEKLSLRNCQITSLAALSKHPSLESLDLHNVKISDFSVLPTLPKLNKLRISIPIKSSSIPFSKIPNLKSLSLSGATVENTEFLKRLPKLEYLGLINTNGGLVDIEKYPAMLHLQELYISNNSIKNTGLIQQKFSNLTNLSLSSCRLRNLNFLKPSTTLKSLSFYNNHLSDLKPLQQITNLYSLNLARNNITSLADIKKLTTISRLYLDGNRLKSLADLEDIFLNIERARYQYVDIENNKIDLTKNSQNKKILDRLNSSGVNVLHKNGNKL